METIATILQIVIFTAYVAFIQNRYGILSSISASTYKLEGKERLWFLAFLGSLAVLNLFQGMGAAGVAGAGGLLLAGVTLDHARSGAHTNIMHTIGTVGAIVATYIGLIALHGMWISAGLLLAGIIYLWNRENSVWYIEILAMGIAMISYLLR